MFKGSPSKQASSLKTRQLEDPTIMPTSTYGSPTKAECELRDWSLIRVFLPGPLTFREKLEM